MLFRSEPACLSDTYVSLSLFETFLSDPEPQSLYDWFGMHDRMPSWGEDSVVADAAVESEAELLEIDPGAPVLRISRRAYAAEQVCEVSRSAYRANQFTLWVPVLRAEFER